MQILSGGKAFQVQETTGAKMLRWEQACYTALKEGSHCNQNTERDEVRELTEGQITEGLAGHCKNSSFQSE